MPPTFRNYFIAHNTIITYRIIRGMFQSRYRRNGVNIETAAISFEEMKQKTIQRLNKAFGEEPPTPIPTKQKAKPEQVSTVQAQPIQSNTVAPVPNEVHQTLFINYLIVMLWDGHEQDKEVRSSKVDREYTTYSKEYHYSESRKVNYEL